MKVTDSTLAKRYDALEMPSGDASVVDRIRYLITLMRKTQAQFGELIDVDPSNMSKIMSGRLRVTDRIINRIVVNLGVSKQWLTEGTDVPFPREISAGETGNRRPHDLDNDNGSFGPSQTGAPVYDIDVTAGCQELSRMFTDDRIIGYFKMANMESEHPIVHVSGNSMAPDIKHNSYIQIRPISDYAPIFWGATYLVVLDDYRMVKVIRRHPDSNKVILHSNNPDYDDIELFRSEIKKLYLVEAVMNYNILV